MLPRISTRLVAMFGYGLLGCVIGAMGLYLYQVGQWPDLQPWHTAVLDEEFRASRADEIQGLGEYRRLEDRLFAQLHEEVYEQTSVYGRRQFNRYSIGSEVDPGQYGIDWNRTFEMPVANPAGGVLLLHGLSDSPYSMRPVAEVLHNWGFWVVGLRLPGHGTAPSGLVDVRWEDFTAATRMAARDLSRRLGKDLPLFLTGYSNGAALAVEYSLAVLEGEDLPAPDGLILLSPAIGVSPVAALAHWQGRLASLPGLAKLGWMSVLPEFDPYKYNSFAINASEQSYELTTVIARRLEELANNGGLAGFPHVLAFQSAVDSTIPPDGVVNRLLHRLDAHGHELVLFDINRHAEAEPFMAPGAGALTHELLEGGALPFDLTVVTNRSSDTNEVVALHKPPASTQVQEEALGMSWPPGVYSLSHLALPFPADDPLYGSSSGAGDRTINLGNLELRGEMGILVVPSRYFMRLRYNPFFPYLEHRMIESLTALIENRGLAD